MITDETISQLLGLVNRTLPFKIVDALLQKNPAQLLSITHDCQAQGHSATTLLIEVLRLLKDGLVLKLHSKAETSFWLTDAERSEMMSLIEPWSYEAVDYALEILISGNEKLRYSTIPYLILETYLLRAMRAQSIEPLIHLLREAQPGATPAAQLEAMPQKHPQPTIPSSTPSSGVAHSTSPSQWQALLHKIQTEKPQTNTTAQSPSSESRSPNRSATVKDTLMANRDVQTILKELEGKIIKVEPL